MVKAFRIESLQVLYPICKTLKTEKKIDSFLKMLGFDMEAIDFIHINALNELAVPMVYII